ncbi:MAG: hypothetical protein A2934_05065 [Candidatus Sungbacteria bacterium RIFCSPLOWO2_01_FULL_47_10]|uniref:FCP1 homology domain-containing protein n=1 Tax=Candidatus Sungbacteria bacterium RIFCSPLOWO2_01_FULL_47_10 TaxID=1802276 RepID=A0A1G2L0B9_9BACT|nr:MAG: hypothetical protein A2934_05065 [Candidatus Sungbacteria bacterium RIFCSPLOWO2_01_FULL_47_10]
MEDKTKILLFDFDGVIVNTFDISYRITKTIVPNLPDEDGFRGWFDGNILYNEDIKLNNAKIDENTPFFKTYIPLLMELEPAKGMIEAIKELHTNHRMVVISSSISSPIKNYLIKHDLSRHFDKIYGGDIHKSKRVKVRMVFEEFNAGPEDCIFITDTLGDMREARKAGIKSVGVTWGFQKIEALQKGDPIAIVNSPGDLLALLKEQ